MNALLLWSALFSGSITSNPSQLGIIAHLEDAQELLSRGTSDPKRLHEASRHLFLLRFAQDEIPGVLQRLDERYPDRPAPLYVTVRLWLILLNTPDEPNNLMQKASFERNHWPIVTDGPLSYDFPWKRQRDGRWDLQFFTWRMEAAGKPFKDMLNDYADLKRRKWTSKDRLAAPP